MAAKFCFNATLSFALTDLLDRRQHRAKIRTDVEPDPGMALVAERSRPKGVSTAAIAAIKPNLARESDGGTIDWISWQLLAVSFRTFRGEPGTEVPKGRSQPRSAWAGLAQPTLICKMREVNHLHKAIARTSPGWIGSRIFFLMSLGRSPACQPRCARSFRLRNGTHARLGQSRHGYRAAVPGCRRLLVLVHHPPAFGILARLG